MLSLMWFRSDLRTRDNPALRAACVGAGTGVVGVFVICPDQWRRHDWGAPKVDFVLRHVRALSESLESLNIPLRILSVDRFENVPEALKRLALRLECDRLHFNAELEVNERSRDHRVTELLESHGVRVVVAHDQTLIRPDDIRTGSGSFYTVFTPFRKAWLKHLAEVDFQKPLPAPKKQRAIDVPCDRVPRRLSGFAAQPVIAARWPAGEREAARRLRRFLGRHAIDYALDRDRCDRDGTSSLSPYLACGAVSVRTCFAAARRANDGRLDGGHKGLDTWISELIWREFYRHVMTGFPRVSMNRAFRTATEKLEWRYDEGDFEAWCAGRTGYPIVDAAMRCLQTTGWMHNRLRMIVSMFLTKDLRIDWRWGERHFMRHLVDGDLASNNGGWQWSASTGTDAAPYFRIFNPVSQSKKCDPEGVFIRSWVSELEDVEGSAVHDPPPPLRVSVGYPDPIVDHVEARRRTIAAFRSIS